MAGQTGVPGAAGSDTETRARLLDAARRLFAANGFKTVTVREICRAADANVAAVNYHFGGKMGLYREVLASAIAVMQSTTEIAREQGEGLSADERLRVLIHVFIDRVVRQGRDSWIHQLMMHEMADPTPELDTIVERVIRPRMQYVCAVIAEILDAPVEDERVLRCCMSVQSQFYSVIKSPSARQMVPELAPDDSRLDEIADHITAFSLAGIRALVTR
jgi:AcrR family transcriptional regulator